MVTAIDLHTKYRPATLEKVIGQEAVVKSVRTVLKKRSSRSFIFTGPSGTGKTTLARVIALMVGCDVDRNLIEVDAASHTGIDAMRAITQMSEYTALGGKGIKVFLIDEAHALSKQAWQSLLKSVEEPPRHVYWIFCSTEPLRIPETIRTRCATYDLKAVGSEDIFELLKEVATAEEFTTGEDVLYLIAEKSYGSPRRALTFLGQCSALTSRKEAAKLLRAATEDGDVADLCRALMSGTNWAAAMKLVAPLREQKGESIRQVVVNWFTKVTMDAKDPNRAQKCLAVLQAFGTPYPSEAGIYPVILSLGELLF